MHANSLKPKREHTATDYCVYLFLKNEAIPQLKLLKKSKIRLQAITAFSVCTTNLYLIIFILFKRFQLCMDFVSNFERQCGSQASISRLRSSEAYNALMTHWSLPVYFQIRYLNIIPIPAFFFKYLRIDNVIDKIQKYSSKPNHYY